MPLTRHHSGIDVAPFHSLPASALRACLREGYSWPSFQKDLLAGLVVGIVALPLSIALAIAVGVSPQQGLYTAIVSGLVVSFLGGSRTQVTGPTAAFVVILAPIFVKFGLAGLLMAGFFAGVILVGLALARMGKLLQFIPHPVTTGFTAGIAVVIGTLQLKDFLGLTVEHMPEHYLERVAALAVALPTTSFTSLCFGAGTLAILLYSPRVQDRIPAPLIAIGIAAASVFLLQLVIPDFAVETIGSRFSLSAKPPMPVLPWRLAGPVGGEFVMNLVTMRALIQAAFAIAMLGAIESLLSAVVADGMAGTRHNPDSELFALGIGNMVVPFFGGIACTGAIARTATNIRAGAKTPIACMVHSLTILLLVLALAPALRYIPMASLAALLLVVAWRMSEVKHFIHIARAAPKSDVSVLLTCFGLTVTFDMVVGVTVGIVLAALLFMRRMAEVTRSTVISRDNPPVGRSLDIPAGVLVYDIAGPLFFGAAEKAMSALRNIGTHHKVVILDLSNVPAMDATGLVALESALASIRKSGAKPILSGLHSQPRLVFEKARDASHPDLAVTGDLEAALELARKIVDPVKPESVSGDSVVVRASSGS